MKPQVSVIVTTKNEENNIVRCLRSVKNQGTEISYEIILVDNFSTDRTVSLGKPYTTKVIKAGNERSTQRNVGAKYSEGKYILFLDADMELISNALNECIEITKKYKKRCIICLSEKSTGTTFWGKAIALERNCYKKIIELTGARFFPRREFLKYGGYDQSLISAEDWDITQRIKAKDIPLYITQHDCVVHHEPPLPIFQLLKKELYYISNISAYQRKHPQAFSVQRSFKFRLSIWIKNWKKLIIHPVLTIGFIFYKSLVFVMWFSSKKNNVADLPQPLTAKIGEVNFREKLSSQHYGRQMRFGNEYTKKEMEKIIKQKTERAINDFKKLQTKKIINSPFLDIGAGYGQSSVILTNKYKARGFALDIAINPLIDIPQTAKSLHMLKIPQRIVADAENLPFDDNSFPFIFCYQTLHHFPHPGFAIKEVNRVLKPGGYFFFAEEPIAQTMNIPLWRRPTKLRWWEKILKYTLILPFVSRIGKTEVDQGILEEVFSLKIWKETLNVFNNVSVSLFPFPIGPKGTLIKKNGEWKFNNLVNRIFLFFLGGGITGICKKESQTVNKNNKISFICVNCLPKSHLIKKNGKYICPNCRKVYREKGGITILLNKKLEKVLYP